MSPRLLFSTFWCFDVWGLTVESAQGYVIPRDGKQLTGAYLSNANQPPPPLPPDPLHLTLILSHHSPAPITLGPALGTSVQPLCTRALRSFRRISHKPTCPASPILSAETAIHALGLPASWPTPAFPCSPFPGGGLPSTPGNCEKQLPCHHLLICWSSQT